MEANASTAHQLPPNARVGELLEQYRGYLTLLARLQVGRLRGRADPAGLVRDALLAARQHWEHFHGATEADLLAWLRCILAAKAADIIRTYGSHAGGQRSDARLGRDPSAAPGSPPEVPADSRERGVLLAAALDWLPGDCREVLVLRHVEGLSFPEVGRRMGRGTEAVKALWARAVARLQVPLKDVG